MSGADGTFEIDPRQFLAPEDELDGVPEDGSAPVDAPVPATPASATAADGVASLGRIEDELNDVEAALARLDADGYGMCDSCGQPIAEARLAADPLQRFCEPHAPAGAQ